MPLTFRVATHEANKVQTYGRHNNPNAKKLYTQLNREYRVDDVVWMSSLDSYRGPIPASTDPTFPLSKITTNEKSGFVQTVFTAYNNHHHLILRPDDLWICIISQFALFLENKEHSEALREWFTDSGPGGKKNIHVVVNHLSEMPDEFRRALSKVVLDKELIPWIIPEFTTTTKQDREVASYLLMGALKNYFTYSSLVACGIPSVTLLGEKKDYEEMLRRINYLDKFNQSDLSAWAKLLRAVVQKAFIDPFDMSDDESRAKVVDTWAKVVDYHRGSGMSSISGWLTAFTFFGKKGTPVIRPGRFRSNDPRGLVNPSPLGLLGTEDQFGEVDSKQIAPGFAEVDIKVYGLKPKIQSEKESEEINMKVIVGAIGTGKGVLVEGEEGVGVRYSHERRDDDDTLFPVNAWWIVEPSE